MQTEAIEAYCKGKGWDLVDIIVERGKSAGEGKKRPGLDRARKMIRTGEATGLVVWKIDRCSRSVKDFSEIISELRKHDADFVSSPRASTRRTPMGGPCCRSRWCSPSSNVNARRTDHGVARLPASPGQGPGGRGDAARLHRHKDVVNGVEKSVGPWLVDEAAAAVIKGTIAVYLESGSTRPPSSTWRRTVTRVT